MPKQITVIITSPKSKEFLDNILESIKDLDKEKYPVLIFVNNAGEYRLEKQGYGIIFNKKNGFELGALKKVLEETDADEILLLHDSCQIKDLKLFDLIFEKHKGISAAISPCPTIFGMHLGKYRREILNKMNIPEVLNQGEAIRYEMEFNNEYVRNDPSTVLLFPEFRDVERFEQKFGRLNMILENEYLIKYKGTWSPSMAEE